MIKLYLKQAWTLIKQNKLFTSIYVVGTGLSIALTMTMFIIFYVKFAPIYPEYNRDRMLTIKAMKCYPKTNKESWNCNGGASYYLVDKMLKDLPHLENWRLKATIRIWISTTSSWRLSVPVSRILWLIIR